MTGKATPQQKHFLRRLGCSESEGLTRSRASQLIEQFLEEERRTGRTFPCPYCRGSFGPRPKHRRKCPHCGKTIYHIAGKFYTEQQKDELDQKEWFRFMRRVVRNEIREDWAFYQEFGKPSGDAPWGYLVKIGPECTHVRHIDGLLILLADAKIHPEMLPPYDGCRRVSCKCTYELLEPDQVPEGTRVAELAGDNTTGGRKTGCLVLFAVVAPFALLCCTLVSAT